MWASAWLCKYDYNCSNHDDNALVDWYLDKLSCFPDLLAINIRNPSVPCCWHGIVIMLTTKPNPCTVKTSKPQIVAKSDQGCIMASFSFNAPQRITFGVELEILVPYLFSAEPDPAEDVDTRRVIRISQSSIPGDSVGDALREFLESHGAAAYPGPEAREVNPPTKWSVSRDGSVVETEFRAYRWVGMELGSPALFADDNSFTEIKRVVSLLRAELRLRINETTGFHVHVGLGSESLPSRAVLRLAQFLWCADGMLSHLHPPERMLSTYCPSIRHESYLARREPDSPRWDGDSTMVDGQDTTSESQFAAVSDRVAVLQQSIGFFPALEARSGTSRLQRFSPVRTNPFEDVDAQQRYRAQWRQERETKTRREFLLVRWPSGGLTDMSVTSVLGGLLALCQPEMRTDAPLAVRKISIPDDQRANYNCNAYRYRNVGRGPRRMTVEFREATGSLDASWVEAWAKITSRIVGFCLEAREEEFVEVLMRVLEAELAYEANQAISRYDVIDLLNDLGMSEEARFVEERILMGDRNRFWFPCALEENDGTSAPIMVPPE